MKPKISVLVAARKNSKYLAKFLHGYFTRTEDLDNTEILVMLNKDDTWNDDLVNYYDIHDHRVKQHYVKFFREDYNLGRAGLHMYFNDLLKHAKGDWIVYFCEDHFIIYDGWDEKVRYDIGKRQLNPQKVNVIVPVFDNAGAMNHIVSRGYVSILGDLGKHGWIDSYINHVCELAFGHRLDDTRSNRLVRNIDEKLFHDFTHDHPNPMSDAHLQSISPSEGHKLPKFDTDEVRSLVGADAEKLKEAMREGL